MLEMDVPYLWFKHAKYILYTTSAFDYTEVPSWTFSFNIFNQGKLTITR